MKVVAAGRAGKLTASLPQAPSELEELEQTAQAGVTGEWLASLAASISDAVIERHVDKVKALRELVARVDRTLVVERREPRTSPSRTALDALGVLLRLSFERLERSQLRLSPTSVDAKMLLAIRACPGISNEDVGGQSGIDFTAVSRSGRRLQQMGLAQPTRYGRVNAWSLTPHGADVAKALGRELRTARPSRP